MLERVYLTRSKLDKIEKSGLLTIGTWYELEFWNPLLCVNMNGVKGYSSEGYSGIIYKPKIAEQHQV